MPYTKEQLKNNEHYERVIEATRREQINTFVYSITTIITFEFFI